MKRTKGPQTSKKECMIGIDPGTRCGWAIRHENGNMDFGEWNLKPDRFQGGGMRFVHMRQQLQKLLDTSNIKTVYFEEVRRHMSTDAAHIYGGILAVLTEECEVRAIPYQGIPVGTVKKFATGKGNASKDLMMKAAKQRWPEIKTDNEADACWIVETGHKMNKQ